MHDQFQLLFNIVVGVAGAMGGFILKAVWDGLKELQGADKKIIEDVSKLQVLVAGNYVTWDGLKDALKPVTEQLNRIETKLDKKADKENCPHIPRVQQ